MSRPSKIAIVKELGSRTPRCLAAHAVRGNDEPELVVVERYPAALGADVLAVIEEDTKELSTLDHTNIATLIATVKLKGDVAVLSEWVDGESLASISMASQKPSFEVLLRVLVDVLEAMSALHAATLHGEGRVCGALTPDDVFVGVDGVTRIARFGLGRVAPNMLGKSRLGYMAPEFARGERNARGDVFTAGVLLWEAFTGDLLERGDGADAPRVDASKRDDWAAGLADVIAKALALDPQARYASAREMSNALTSAGAKIAPRAAVSQYIARVFGEKIDARIGKLEPKVDVSLSMTPTATTEPPPAIDAKTPKPPVISAEPIAKPAEIKPIETKPKAVETKIESTPRLPTAPQKPTPSTPDTTVAAVTAAATPRKAVPLPLPKKAPNQPDSAPSLIASARTPEVAPKIAPQPIAPAKTNGARPLPTPATPMKTTAIADTKIAAKKLDVVKPAEPAKVEPPAMPSVLVDFDSEPPPPSSNELDDVDVVSVRPPPMAKKAPKEEEPRVVAEAKAVAPPPPVLEEKKEDEQESPQESSSMGRGLLLFFGGVVLFCGGFLAGRFTAPAEVQPPAPMPTTSVAPPATTLSGGGAAPIPTVVIDAGVIAPTATTTDKPRAPIRAFDSPIDASTRASDAHYEPNGI